MFERMDPKTLMMWLIVAGLLYFIFPYDLLPDFLGFAGRIDDLLIIAWLVWFYRQHSKSFAASGFGFESNSGGAGKTGVEGEARQGSPAGAKTSKTSDAFDAYAVLGIPRSASPDAIQTAYRARMVEYHPDKVSHLGEELQRLAHEKSQQIQRAYQQLRR